MKRKLKAPPIKQRRQSENVPKEIIDGPAVVSALHRQDRVLGPGAGAAKGFRRIDRLQWLNSSKSTNAIGLRLIVKSLAAFFRRLVLPEPRRPKIK